MVHATTRTPILGTRADQAGAVRAGAAAVAIASIYVVAVRTWSPELSPSGLEVGGTITSLACVWLTRTQNIWSVIYGLASVVAMGIFFFNIDLVGQGWLHLGYYIPVQVVGWWAWLRGGAGGTELAVRWLTSTTRSAIGLSTTVGTVLLAVVFHELHGETPYLLWDTSIVAASVAAQLLLMTKRMESWFLWLLPVDVSAILLYVRTDAEMFAALYCVYLGLAGLGLRDWIRAWRTHDAGLTAFEARNALAIGS